MFKKLFAALGFKAKKSNEITRIKTPARLAINPRSDIKLSSLQVFCPVCCGDKKVLVKSSVSVMSLTDYTDCPVCCGTGCYTASYYCQGGFYKAYLNQHSIKLILEICWKKEAFKIPLDAPKFLPMVVS